MPRIIRYFFCLILLFGLAGRIFGETSQERAARLAQQSIELRKQPPLRLTGTEQEAQAFITKAKDLAAKVETSKDVDQVIKLFSEATALSPDYDQAWFGLGAAYCLRTFYMPQKTKEEKAQALEYLGRAKSACNRALALNPDCPGANYWMSNILITEANLRNIAVALFRLPEILRYSQKVEEVDPYYEYGAIYRTYGMSLALMPDWMTSSLGAGPEVILPYVDQAILMEPNCFSNHNVRAFILNKMGGKENKQKALSELEYSLGHSPDSLAGYQADNLLRQKEARILWKMFTGKEYPDQ